MAGEAGAESVNPDPHWVCHSEKDSSSKGAALGRRAKARAVGLSVAALSWVVAVGCMGARLITG